MRYKQEHANTTETTSNSSNHNVAFEIRNEYIQCKHQLTNYKSRVTTACIVTAILATPIALVFLFMAASTNGAHLRPIATILMLAVIILSSIAAIRTYNHNELLRREQQLRQEYLALKSLVKNNSDIDLNTISRDEISLLGDSNNGHTEHKQKSLSLGQAILVIVVVLIAFYSGKMLLSPNNNTNTNNTATPKPTYTQPPATQQPTYSQPTYTQSQPNNTPSQPVSCFSNKVGDSVYTNCF